MTAGPKVPSRSEAGKAGDPAATGGCRDAEAHSGREHCVIERGARGHLLAWIERRSSMGPSWPASRCLEPFGRREPSPVREKERPVFGHGEVLLSGLEHAGAVPEDGHGRDRCLNATALARKLGHVHLPGRSPLPCRLALCPPQHRPRTRVSWPRYSTSKNASAPPTRTGS